MNRRDRRRMDAEERKTGKVFRQAEQGPHDSGEFPLARSWDSFVIAVMPPHASAVQRKEMRRAFYAGAQAFYGMLMSETTEASEVEDPDVTLMANIDAELRQFALDLQLGKA